MSEPGNPTDPAGTPPPQGQPPESGDPPEGHTPPPDPGEPQESDSDEVKALKTALANQRRINTEATRQAAEIRRELEELKRSQMSDPEKALADARAAARREVLSEVGAALAESRLRSLAAGKVADVDGLVEVVGSMARFVGDDGKVDDDALTAIVDRAAKWQPAANGSRPATARQGVGEPTTPDANAWLRAKLTGKPAS